MTTYAQLTRELAFEELHALLRYAEWDWVVTGRWDKLHHLAAFDDPEQAGKDWGGPARLSCGRHSKFVCIPGVGTRMDAPRCQQCCRKLGYPDGIGSPKNDDRCRPLIEARLAS
jgi:hypothetical protein